MAVVDYFLKIDGIEGESQDAKHKGEIELTSFSWGASNNAQVATGGGGRGRVTLQDFVFTAASNKSSPKLFLACASGTHIKSAILSVRKAGTVDKQNFDYIKLTMSNVLVNFYKEQGPNTDTEPHDEVGLLFQKAVFEVAPQVPVGTAAASDISSATVDAGADQGG